MRVPRPRAYGLDSRDVIAHWSVLPKDSQLMTQLAQLPPDEAQRAMQKALLTAQPLGSGS